TATAALAAAAAGRAEASASAPEISSPPAPARLTLAGDAWANGATAEINRALGGSGVTLAPAPTGQEGDLSLRYADEWRAGGGAPGLVAIARLYDCEAHLAATGGARFIGDLAGKRIDIGAPGSPGAATARRLLTLLGVAATLNEIPPDEALRRLARGETDATLIIAPRPAAPALPKGAAYVAIPYAPALREAFVPAELPRGDGAPVDTVAVAAVLTAREPDPDSDAHRRLERFAQALHKGLPRLAATAAPMQAKWQDVNFSARTGLPRFAPAQALIDKAAAN
ncbi:MAG: hypothetical protein JNK46_11360, partial [Methylobacteriaceae bacterium]|nr:hypothetical protein [Methylobacteriaceae bacterium]